MLIAILQHTPLWVWGLLAALLSLGLWQTRPRRVPPARLLLLPLAMLALGLWTMGPRFVALPAAAATWLLAMAAGMTFGSRLKARAGAHWIAAERRLHVPGSWMPLTVISVVFALRYALGVAAVLQPAWAGSAPVQMSAAALFGAVSGLLLGRTLALLRAMRALQQPTIARHDPARA